MSFILDALKKSEVERQRQTAPGLMDAGRAPQGRRFPLWAAALAVLLGVNLIVLAVMLLRHGAAAPPVAPTAATPLPPQAADAVAPRTGATMPPAAAQDHFSPMPGPPTYAPEIPLAQPELAPAAAEPKSAAHRETPPVVPAQTTDEPDEVLPSLSELNLTGPGALPELHLDVHVFATSSADRFVYINMRKYHEGARLQEGPTIERIRRDGVVLNSQGLRFLLPRNQ